jgi:hypothetical protein
MFKVLTKVLEWWYGLPARRFRRRLYLEQMAKVKRRRR